jgi:hypothetical protein
MDALQRLNDAIFVDGLGNALDKLCLISLPTLCFL